MPLSFGIESEQVYPFNPRTDNLLRSFIPYHGEFAQARAMTTGWSAQRDSSIQDLDGDGFTAEIVSEVLAWPTGLERVKEMLARSKELGAKTNHTCGLHVHVGARDLDSYAIERLKRLVRRYEFAFYGSAGSSIVARMASAHGQRYCKPSTYGISTNDRYQGLNLARLTGPSRARTVEFRMFAGTLVESRVIGCIAMSIASVMQAMDGRDESDGRIPRPIEAMKAMIGEVIEPAFTLDAEVRRSLLRQARKAEVMLGSL